MGPRTSILFILMVACIQGLRLSDDRLSNSERSCADDPKGEWQITEGTAVLKEFRQMVEKYPKLCTINIDHDSPCSADKYSEKFVSECLKPFDPEVFFNRIKGKTLSLIGDSMTSQLFERTLCSIAPFAEAHVDTIERQTKEGGPRDWGFMRYSFKDGTVVQFQFLSKERLSVLEKGSSFPFNSTIFDADFIVANIGAWYHLGEQDNLELALTEIHDRASKGLRRHGRLFFREYFPTHFPVGITHEADYSMANPRGTITLQHLEGEQDKKCQRRDIVGNLEVERMRLNYVNELMRRKGWELLKTFTLASTKWYMHKEDDGGALDCRHWCQPSPILDATKMILSNLLEER